MAAAIVAAPVLVLAVECLAAALPRRPVATESELRRSVAVVVPAHDEKALIAATIRSILPQLVPGDRLLVIADNCTDATASIARAAGANVVERCDPDRRGKGYALACGIEALRASPPEVVIVCDADLPVPAGAIDHLARQVVRSNRAVQAQYVLAAENGAGTRQIISSLAFLVKNIVRPMGLDCLGLAIPLTGTGMAFPWAAIAQAPLADGDIVEDMRLGIYMLRAGFGARLCRSVTIRGTLPPTTDAALQQRKRWEHGHLKVLISTSVPLLLHGVRRLRLSLILAALDYSVPPLALLVLAWSGLFFISLLLSLNFGVVGPLGLNAVTGCLLAVAILLSWAIHGRHLPLAALLGIPRYVFWKIPLYVQFMVKRQTRWVRTPRSMPHEAASLGQSPDF